MRKRLRKKKHLCEFKEYAVEFSVHFRAECGSDQFFDEFLEHVVEANGMTCGMGMTSGEPKLSGVLELGYRDVYKVRLESFERALKEHPDVVSFGIGNPFDCWYGPLPSEQ